MSRSTKKGPFIDQRLLDKVMKQEQTGDKTPIKTWSRACVVAPQFVNHTFLIHQGKKFVEVFITEAMVGHKLGEFAPTRTLEVMARLSRELSLRHSTNKV